MKLQIGNKVPVSIVLLFLLLTSCKKSSTPSDAGGGGNTNGNQTAADSVYSPVDPSLPGTIGFFNDAWTGKSFTAPPTMAGTVPAASVTDAIIH